MYESMVSVSLIRAEESERIEKNMDRFLVAFTTAERNKASSLLQFVRDACPIKTDDDSHSWEHSVRVALGAFEEVPTKEALVLGLVHDVCDHKYVQPSRSRQDLRDILRDTGFSHIDCLVDRVSYTAQLQEPPGLFVPPELEAVRDADRIEALGLKGLQRCISFAKSRGDPVPRAVVNHAYIKLLRLVPEGFITLQTPRVIKAHNIVVDYVNQHRDPLHDPEVFPLV